MKTSPALLCLTVACVPFFNASAQRSTAPVGYLSYPLPATAALTTTYISAPLSPASTYTGTVASAGADTINATGTDWTGNEFARTPCHVLMTSGSEAGRTLRILGKTATQLTVDVTDGTIQTTDLDTAGFAVGAGDGFEIVADDTLGGFFGATTDAMALVGGANAGTADLVGLWNGKSGVFEFYYFYTVAGHWVKDGDAAMLDATDLVITPGAAMAIVRQPGRPAGRLALAGAPPAIAPLLKTTGGDVVQYYGAPFPVDLTLGQLNFAKNWRKKKSVAKADTLLIYQTACAKWRPYHERRDGIWVRGNGTKAKNGKTVYAGSVLGFLKHKPVSGVESFVQITLPYTP